MTNKHRFDSPGTYAGNHIMKAAERSSRSDLNALAADNGWTVIRNNDDDVYRQAPMSIMVTFRRGDDSVIAAQLFRDAPDPRQKLMPRTLASIDHDARNKAWHVRQWLKEHRTRAR